MRFVAMWDAVLGSWVVFDRLCRQPFSANYIDEYRPTNLAELYNSAANERPIRDHAEQVWLLRGRR